jgi:hypothetical protein
MGGAVRAVQQPIKQATKAVQQVVGGASKAANTLVGNKPEAPAAAAAAPAPEAAKPVERRASAADEMMGARMRGARRRGRQLLSDARLNAESGVQTLGGGQSLGQ